MPYRIARDERGAVYVEFLIAFMPLFFLFLGICQLALLATARLVVQHAVLTGARTAIVVLEDEPSRYDGARRGVLSGGRSFEGIGELFSGVSEAGADSRRPQYGSRMKVIRTAAEYPLLALAPGLDAVRTPRDSSVSASLVSNVAASVSGAFAYTRAAAVVTLHEGGDDELATEPVPRNAAVTVRVTYLYSCGIPMVRALVCQSRAAILKPASLFSSLFGGKDSMASRFKLAEEPNGLARLSGDGAYFSVLSAEATLPNQGAAFEHRGDE